MENIKIDSNKKIIEQLPKGVSIEDFWECVKLYEQKYGGGNPKAEYQRGDIQKLKDGIYTDRMITGTMKELPELLKEIKQEYKGGI